MMSAFSVLLIGLFLQLSLVSHSWASAAPPELIVSTYDSLIAAGGLGPEIFPLFEARCACRVRAIASGDAGQILTRLQLDAERGKTTAHVVLGIDQHTWSSAKPYLETEKAGLPRGFERIGSHLRVEDGFVPFDYGVFAFMVDHAALKKSGLAPPRALRDLLKPEWRRNFVLEDPRTSTPGLAFLLFSRSLLGDEAWTFWADLRGRWLTLAPSWSAAYGLFLKGETPLVWSYTTSQAYHEEKGKEGDRYRVVLFDEGQPLQIEGAAIVKGALKTERERLLARQFLEFLLSPEVQSRIPLRNWMLPVVRGTPLPKSFQRLPQPRRIVPTSASTKDVHETLAKWGKIVGGVKAP